MARKPRKKEDRKTYRKQQQEQHERWMIRLTVSVVYVLMWIIVMSWVTSNLPDPVSASRFYEESKAHWFMNIGLAIMFIVIQYYLGAKPTEEPVEESEKSAG